MDPLPELPRVRLLAGPTPLQPLPRLSATLGGRADLWIKREDLGPLAFSGNKLRNLEFLLGRALADGADTVITSGRRWSNHCRLTAAAGAKLGLTVHVVVSGPPVGGSANVRLMRELGATVHEAATDARAEREALVEQVAAAASADGSHVAVLPVGGSEPAGAWGQVLAALEALDQAGEAGLQPGAIFVPTATGGTQAGLVVGAALHAARSSSPPVAVQGVAVHPDPDLRGKVEHLVVELSRMAGMVAPAGSVAIDTSQIGPGYGLPSEASEDAAHVLASSEGIFVDPVYTSKGLAGLIAAVRSGALDGRSAVFWHGGGLPALFEPALGR
jgi:1-aminocyclopropane-1-carboxylate deaminase/D-cysteine desulfhydrase-like pyridoxal-dependent ACC family enzyme